MEGRRILVIAGSDSSGGAGLEADQKVIAHHHCYAMTATTALTAQNTLGVRRIHNVPSDFVTEQIDAVFDDVGVDVVKIGMLGSAKTIEATTAALERRSNPTIVLDPVMIATSGAQLLPDEAVVNMRELLLPASTILTPNIPEAKLILQDAGVAVPETTSIVDLISIAGQIQSLGPKYVLVKGGHLPLNMAGQISTQEADHHIILNVFHDGQKAILFETDYISSRNTHGTGCSLASAIASQMVLHPSRNIIQQVKSACQYVEMGIRTNIDRQLGKGSGAINHFHDLNDQASLRVREVHIGR